MINKADDENIIIISSKYNVVDIFAKYMKYEILLWFTNSSALSPCADILMSPNNILNMAYLKELNIMYNWH